MHLKMIKKAYRKLSKNITQISTRSLVLRKSTRKFKKLMRLWGRKKRAAGDQYGAAGYQWWLRWRAGGFGGFDGAGFGGFEDIFSAFGGGATVIRMLSSRGWPPIPRQSQVWRSDFCAEKSQVPSKLAVIPVMVLELNQGLGPWPVDAVMVLESSIWYANPSWDDAPSSDLWCLSWSGQEIKDPCTTCRGTGHEKQAHSVNVKFLPELKRVNKSA